MCVNHFPSRRSVVLAIRMQQLQLAPSKGVDCLPVSVFGCDGVFGEISAYSSMIEFFNYSLCEFNDFFVKGDVIHRQGTLIRLATICNT